MSSLHIYILITSSYLHIDHVTVSTYWSRHRIYVLITSSYLHINHVTYHWSYQLPTFTTIQLISLNQFTHSYLPYPIQQSMHLTCTSIMMCLTHPIHNPNSSILQQALRQPRTSVKLSTKPPSNHSPVKPIGQRGTMYLLCCKTTIKSIQEHRYSTTCWGLYQAHHTGSLPSRYYYDTVMYMSASL
jgi:hypothetical protein